VSPPFLFRSLGVSSFLTGNIRILFVIILTEHYWYLLLSIMSCFFAFPLRSIASADAAATTTIAAIVNVIYRKSVGMKSFWGSGVLKFVGIEYSANKVVVGEPSSWASA
jgi:hypothetical protein